jgi:hypothetical protein
MGNSSEVHNLVTIIIILYKVVVYLPIISFSVRISKSWCKHESTRQHGLQLSDQEQWLSGFPLFLYCMFESTLFCWSILQLVTHCLLCLTASTIHVHLLQPFEYKKKKRVSYNHTRLRKVGASPNIPITETGAPYCVAELRIFSEPALYD